MPACSATSAHSGDGSPASEYFYAGGTDGGFFNYTLTAGINYALTEAWTVGASLSLSDRLDDDALPDEVVDTTVYGGVSLACTF